MTIKDKKVLVISHNVFSDTNNMGKTMKELLACVPSQNKAQLFFHSERPTVDCCERYFRITDTNMLKSVLSRKGKYRIFTGQDIDKTATTSRTDKGTVGKIYQFARRRTPAIYFLRNLLWTLGVWQTKALREWIEEFAPDVVFYAAGDYAFSYKIAYKIADRYNLPLVTLCCDDYYIGKQQNKSPLYAYNRKNLLKWAHRIMDRTSKIITISDKMRDDYSRLFKKEAVTMRISVGENPSKRPVQEREGVLYIGNLGLNRVDPLIEIGRALKDRQIEGFDKVTVYSGEGRQEVLDRLTEENGIDFKGRVSAGEVVGILGKAKYLLVLEAFDQKSRIRTAYSLSTKIGESLQSGGCILAHGPKEISSMEYLISNNVACFSENAEDIPGFIISLEANPKGYQELVDRGLEVAKAYHNKEVNDKIMTDIISNL